MSAGFARNTLGTTHVPNGGRSGQLVNRVNYINKQNIANLYISKNSPKHAKKIQKITGVR